MTYQFSRVNPPSVLVPVNNNAVGAHKLMSYYQIIITNLNPYIYLRKLRKEFFDNVRLSMKTQTKLKKHHCILRMKVTAVQVFKVDRDSTTDRLHSKNMFEIVNVT